MASKEELITALGTYAEALVEAQSKGNAAFEQADEFYQQMAGAGLAETAQIVNTAKDQLSTSRGQLDSAVAEAEQAQTTAHQAN